MYIIYNIIFCLYIFFSLLTSINLDMIIWMSTAIYYQCAYFSNKIFYISFYLKQKYLNFFKKWPNCYLIRNFIAFYLLCDDWKIASILYAVPPEWLKSPADKEVLSGDAVYLPCSASGKPKPTVIWQRLNGIYNDKNSLISSRTYS